MDKKYYEKYFGKNLARIVYLISLGFLGVGAFYVALTRNKFWGCIFCIIGVILFFITSHRQVSDKNIDEKVSGTAEGYIKEKIDGRIIGKETLDGRNFSVFSGFIRDGGDIRFKAGRDQKIRTSRFFVTAISAERNNCKVFTTVYDLLSEGKPRDMMISTKGAEEVNLTKVPTEFPKGNFKCELTVTKNGERENLVFYVPDDALAEQLLSKVK